VPRFETYFALGDSFTEGLWDYHPDGSLRGWADRLASEIARQQAPEPLRYANVAVRGKLLAQVLADQVPVVEARAGSGDLVTFHAGANDALRPSFDPVLCESLYSEAVKRLVATGATVLLFSAAGREGARGRAGLALAERLDTFNEIIGRTAASTGALIIPVASTATLHDYRFWDSDRLHLNAEGHRRVAEAVLELLGFSYDANWRIPLPKVKEAPRYARVTRNAWWWISFALPWVWRRVRGVSSGDGRDPKYGVPRVWS
jgi:lysophospholipase L1-like esterase